MAQRQLILLICFVSKTLTRGVIGAQCCGRPLSNVPNREGARQMGSSQARGSTPDAAAAAALSAALNANSDDAEKERRSRSEIGDGGKKFAHHNW